MELKSTHPLRDATGDGYYLVHIKGAKIHASLARCDLQIFVEIFRGFC